jgi:hypothetical protein
VIKNSGFSKTEIRTHLHVDVDGVDSRNAKVNPDRFSPNDESVPGSLSRFGIDRIEKFDQTPILNDTLGHSNL